MANLTAQIPAGSTPAPRNYWRDLTEPAAGMSITDTQRARLLASVMVVFLPLAVLTIFTTPIANFFRTGVFTLPSLPLLFTMVLVFASYAISRTTYYRFGSFMIVVVPLLAVTAAVLTSKSVPTTTSYFFLALSIVLASLLMSARETVLAGIASALLAFFLLLAHPVTPGVMEWTVLTFLILVTGITALVSNIRDRNLKALEASQKVLQEQFTETERAREQAERSDKVKSAFLASMSHELRTPLNAIINFTRYVAKGSLGPVNQEQSETLNEVVDSARHLLNLINDVLDMSKIEAGSLKLFIEDNIELKPIVDSVVATGKSLLNEKTVEIKVEIDPALPVIRGDKQRLMQILLNIMSNACKFTEQGDIKMRTYPQNGDVVFAITDSGPGIAPDDMPAVFEAFKQTSSGLRQGGGTGLGMPISRSLAEAHGGKLWVESVPGNGATFFVSVPVQNEALIPSLRN